MEHGFMFGALDKYLNQEYLEKHKTGTLTVGDNIYDIEIFAVVEAPAEEEMIFSPTEKDPTDFIEKHATIYLPHKNEEKLFAMSTCKYPETSDRTIVFSTITKKTT
jgi:sortase B